MLGTVSIQSAAQPLRTTLSRVAIVLRLSATVVVAIAAALGVGGPVRAVPLAGLLIGYVAWSVLYVSAVYRDGLRVRYALADLVVAGLLVLGAATFVPAVAQPAGAGWLANVASVAVICAQLVGRPAATVPAGLAVAACFVAGGQLSQTAGGGLIHGFTLVLQTVITAALVGVLRRTDSGATVALEDYHATARAGAVELVRREAERAELRLLHNGPLTTLTMAAVGGLAPDTVEALRTRAAADLATLRAGPEPDTPARPVRIDESLAATVERFQPPLIVRLMRAPHTVPSAVADAFAAATAEALENVVRHSGTADATVHIGRIGTDGVQVRITDNGRGFDPARVPPQKFGLREAIRGQLAQVGGLAGIRSKPGGGTTVELLWKP
ncbi:hypothetical protein Val02_53600 [Virgisporangium aliadipatigenens]|uniref:Histidine kinase/HSP90-like ATPase domain-containing protein n=1 Tax=Virgisporangium aliadipatigenens TaxID=741659 RepID=A0A8J4DS96_9ACTN|nr:hypothetical protein Val02_53600 [Virgisporangium aliadipatigenens]